MRIWCGDLHLNLDSGLQKGAVGVHEIVETETVGRIFLCLAIFAPLLAILIGAIIGGKHGEVKKGIRNGFLVGLLGPANLLLWNLYNRITDINGLDSVRNVFVNLILFVGIGLVGGGIISYFLRASDEISPKPNNDTFLMKTSSDNTDIPV